MVLQAWLVFLEKWDREDFQVLEASTAYRVLLVFLALRAPMVPRVTKVLLGPLVLQEFLEIRGLLVPLVQSDRLDLLGRLVQEANLVSLDFLVQMGCQETMAIQENLAQKETKDLKDIQALLAFQDRGV